jgi:methionyl aminopeptidase
MISIKTQEEIEIMAEGGKILASALKELKAKVKPGITTRELDEFAENYILSCKALPAFKGYAGFPNALCASVNEVIVHGVPNDYVLKEGDIVKLDLGVLYKAFNTDSAITVLVGQSSFEKQRLLKATQKALRLGIKKVRPGNTTGDIGNTIERFATDQNFGIVRELTGHGIGRKVHEEPEVLNYGKRGAGTKLVEGMVICIEPMLTLGDYKIKKAKDGFGYATKDGSVSAHFEHTIAITKNGARILTEI